MTFVNDFDRNNNNHLWLAAAVIAIWSYNLGYIVGVFL